MDEKELKCPN